MKCYDPLLCYTTVQGKRDFRNFSMANDMFKLMAQQVFNCGKCIFCRKRRSLELSVKCVLHSSLYPHQNSFLTLTYDEKKPTYHNVFDYTDIQKFKKRLRIHCEREHNGKKIEIFNVHEYGRNGKKHWHLICFNHRFPDSSVHTYSKGLPLYTSETLSRLWPAGFSTIGDVSEASAMYQSQYMEKDFKNGNVTNDKKSHSKHSGIGRPFFLKNYKQILSLGFIPYDGKKVPIFRSFQRIAHRHWSHFYEPTNFFDTKYRKKIHNPLKFGEENKELADLFAVFQATKEEHIKELEAEWEETVALHLESGEKPQFLQSAENYLYDLKNKTKPEIF